MRKKNTTIQQDIGKLVIILTFLLYLANPDATTIGLTILFFLIIIVMGAVYVAKRKKHNLSVSEIKIKEQNKSFNGVTKQKDYKRNANAVEKPYFTEETIFEKKQETRKIKEQETRKIKETRTTDIQLDQELWTESFLNSIEWKCYEDLCKMFLALKGYFVKTTMLGADGGVDINIYEDISYSKIHAIVQCKSYTTYKIGVKLIREFYGVMASDKLDYGIFFTTSTFTSDAYKFAKDKKIQLINGKQLIEKIHKLENGQQKKLYKEIISGDYKIPSCPKCGLKMKLRTNKNDSNKKFWGCCKFPKCRAMIKCTPNEKKIMTHTYGSVTLSV